MSDETPRYTVICRAVAAWPDTTSAQMTLHTVNEVTDEEVERCKTNIADLYKNMLGEKADRVAVAVLPYCSSDEDEAPPYEADDDLDDGWQDDD